ncbi:GT4 family glycosyltransferase PelF [Thaumasiovibrio sp. DFM-14]|uniref:GT4 family glycosyltransferase PelF n=1 Tax=Thaumasiovibrio sp. DFM-14 TaxID=3384792 RepID=UPI0039A1F76C
MIFNNKPALNQSEADICLLLEGTYPYVRGGVSSWVYQMIKGLPEFTFHLIFLGGDPKLYNEPAYDFPDNVIGFNIHFLLPQQTRSKPFIRQGKKRWFKVWGNFLHYFESNREPIPGELLQEVSSILGARGRLSRDDFLHSRASWNTLTEHYFKTSKQQSFVDYFWTYRNIYQPLFVLAQISQQLPKAKIYHSISTGYAGFLGALCRQNTGKPFLLTEHGIYTKERKIDLSQAKWIKDNHDNLNISIHRGLESTRRTWINFFEKLGITAYHQANRIVALFEGNRQRQHRDGAPSDRTQVIVNGINIARFNNAYQQRPKAPPLVVGLVGRVVPIKDIKTFIRTIRSAIETHPQLEGWIIGPAEEDPNYVQECILLIESLGLENRVKLLGNQNVAEIMPRLGIMMLTSISEAQPLVLLEAMAAGIPCIATEVGACREIIDGVPGEDAAIGTAGEIISIANPVEGSKAISRLLVSAEQWRQTGDNGRNRVLRYYDEKTMYESYRALYKEAIHGWDRV